MIAQTYAYTGSPVPTPTVTNAMDYFKGAELAQSYLNQPSYTVNSLSNPSYEGYIKPSTGIGSQLANSWNNMDFGQKLNTVGSTVGQALNAYNAFRAMGLAKQQFNFQKDMANKQYEAQRKITNRQLEDRQRSRVRTHPNTSMSVKEYMAKYGV